MGSRVESNGKRERGEVDGGIKDWRLSGALKDARERGWRPSVARSPGRPGGRAAAYGAPSLCLYLRVLPSAAGATASDVPQDGLLLHGPFARKPKRIRTAFSPSQLLRLERAFEKNHYVVGAERKQLAGSLSLSETQVIITPGRSLPCVQRGAREPGRWGGRGSSGREPPPQPGPEFSAPGFQKPPPRCSGKARP